VTAGVEQLSCQELVELVTNYLEGALSEVERVSFEDHIQRCEGCREYVEQMRATIRLTGSLSSADVSPDAERTLIAAFRDWKVS
jgi:predicted anti-sigma-YlaC factor YlaD